MKSVHLNPQQLKAWCLNLVKEFEKRQIVLLQGELGTGKTFLVSTLAKLWGISSIASPTFSLIQEFKTPEGKKIYHLDLYRIESSEDLDSIGFWDLFDEKEAFIFIEWPERLNTKELPLDWPALKVEISMSDKSGERIYRWESL